MPPVAQAQAQPHVVITEQPQSKALRFRYECEGRSAGSIPGVHSTPEQKTFPSIEIRGYKGRAVVVVSCVTKDAPYRPHPHNLVGKEGCKKGVCTVEINSSSMSYTFSNLGIQCVKKKDIEEALRLREEIRVDPYKTGYSHSRQPATIDLNAIRLCFQVFLEGAQRGRFTEPLQPVVSDVIYDKKAMSDLVICKLSDVTASVAGGKEIILLCEKVAKEDIAVRFYEEQNGAILWEGNGEFQHANVHKQVAISFRTPRYRTLEVERSVMVNIQLKRPSDGATSEPLPFELLPIDSAKRQMPNNKRPRPNWNVPETPQAYYGQPPMFKVDDPIKTEPGDSPQMPYPGSYRLSNQTPSPAHPGGTSPYQNDPNRTPTYQYPQQQDLFLNQQYNNNFQPVSPANNDGQQQPFYQLPPNPYQPQPPSTVNNNNNNNNTASYSSLLNELLAQAGPSGTQASAVAPNSFNLSEINNLSGLPVNLDSAEFKMILSHFSNSDFKMELPQQLQPVQQQQQQQQQQLLQQPQQQQQQQQLQQETENLTDSFKNMTASFNDLN